MPLPENQVHPLATSDGKSIPFNIARPHGAIIKAVTDAVSTSFVLSDITIPHVFLSDVDCLIGFNVNPDRTSVVYQASVLFVPSGKEVSVMPLHASLKVQALKVTEVGTLLVQAFERYAGMGRETLQSEL
jgi:hypothetical protein